MTPRIREFLKSLDAVRAGRFPVSVEKGVLMTEAFKASEGEPQVVRCGLALARVLDEIPIFIEPTDLLAGNLASRPGTVELSCLWSTWEDAELDALAESGFSVDQADRPRIRAMNDYWRTRSLTRRMTALYDDERVWPYAQLGVVLPAFRSKEEGWGPGGMVGMGWGVRHEISQIIGVFQYEKVLERGIEGLIAEAKAEQAANAIFSAAAVQKADLLRGVIIALEAVVRYAERFSKLAAEMAAKEADPVRRAELEWMAQACAHVPAKPARTFREALQAFWFTALMILPSNVISFGRFDRLLGPFYEADLAAGRITEDEALELLEWLRIKDSQVVITAGHTHRNKYGGLAKWHNCVVGGQTRDGDDATNALSYLILQAALDCPALHPTLTMRVHAGTPERLMQKAMELIATGVGLPALLSDDSCIEFLTNEGVPLETARDYAVAGCLGANIPGQSRAVVWPMFSAPLVLEFALHGGVDPRTGAQVGPKTPPLVDCETFEAFESAVRAQLAHFLKRQAEFNNITLRSYGERFPQTLETALCEGLLQSGKNVLDGPLPFENGAALNPLGMINVADSLTAVKKLVFEDRSVSAAGFMQAMHDNWAGADGARIHDLALAAPKYGNDDDEADRMAADLYAFWADHTVALTTTFGGRFKPASISIGTSNWPGGAQVGATPDGRGAGEPLADESLSPMRGRDKSGVRALLASALKIDQARWMALALDLRFSREALDTPEKRAELSDLVRSYFAAGGKHIQFNVVSEATLRDAQAHPENHDGLIVRIGGCSAYFAQLPTPVQNEIIQRTEHGGIG